jgi:predicted HicB family RNase H-like nuclease
MQEGRRPLCKEPSEKKRKSASITLRVAAEEYEQLQERAAAAHLSVSAYIRSCIFEAESLRAQVKAALVQMLQIGGKAGDVRMR